MIIWLWNGANEKNRTLRDVAIRIVWLNIAAIRATSAVSLELVTSVIKFDS